MVCIILTTLSAISLYISLSSRDSLYSLFGDTHMVVEIKSNVRVNLLEMNKRMESIEGVTQVEYKEAKASQRELSKELGISIEGFMGGDVQLLPHTFVLTISGSKLLESEGIESIVSELGGIDWVAAHHYDSALSESAKRSFSRIGSLTLYLTVAMCFATALIFYLSLSLSIGGLYNCYPPAAYSQLSRQVYRWAWIHGLLSAVCASAVLVISVALVNNSMPVLNLSMELLPVLCCGLLVGCVLLSLFFAYIVVLFRK